jgi:transposase
VLRDLWQHRTASEAIEFFKDWYNRVIYTNLDPLKVVALSINERLANVVSYCTHGITSTVAEGINSKIKAMKRRVGGYRNRENLKTAIFFYCGGLVL